MCLATSAATADEPTPRVDPPVEEAEEEKPSVAPESVYVGNATNFSKPAAVDADSVYAQIPEYKRIVDEGLEAGTPQYDLLLSKASRRFFKALRAAQKDGGYDLVARVGAVSGVDSVPDITQDVIAKL